MRYLVLISEYQSINPECFPNLYSHQHSTLNLRSMKKVLFTAATLCFSAVLYAFFSNTEDKPSNIQLTAQEIDNPDSSYPKSLASFEDFKKVMLEVESYRAERLVDLKSFLEMSKEEGVIILDARYMLRFDQKHIKGAVNLPFPDFTQNTLSDIIPDANTKILIYCNNNFFGDPIHFASKIVETPKTEDSGFLDSPKEDLTLALNIPTFINLYGYGYTNIYELDELVSMNDPRITFEGEEVGG